MSEADVVYRIVKDQGERGITLAEIQALPQAEGIHAHSAFSQRVVAKRIKTFVSH